MSADVLNKGTIIYALSQISMALMQSPLFLSEIT